VRPFVAVNDKVWPIFPGVLHRDIPSTRTGVGERNDTGGEGERDTGEHQHSILDVIEHHEQQGEDYEQRERHDKLQPVRGRLQLLEGSAPGSSSNLRAP
jgi:hypothetical protein